MNKSFLPSVEPHTSASSLRSVVAYTYTHLSRRLTLLAALLFTLGLGQMWGQITDYTKIVSGQKYYIGATTGSTDYYLSVNGSSTSTSIAGTAVTSKSNATPFTFSGSGYSWTIQFESGYYLSLKNSKDNGKVQVVESAATFTASNQSSKIRLSIGSYSIQKNNSGTQFGSYGNTQTDIWLEPVSGGTQTVETPTFSPAGGTYTSAQSVTISCATTGAAIHYTTDNSTPTASSTTYTGAITVSSTTTIKAIAVKSGISDSDVASALYTIVDCDWYESFAGCTGTGGNDGSWSGSIANSTFSDALADNSGWNLTKGNAASGCIKLGSGSERGSAQTPTLTGLLGTLTIEFRAGAWNGNSESTTLNILSTTGVVSPASVTLVKGEWNTYTVTVTGVSAASQITFQAANPSNNRFFLDDICISASGACTPPTITTQPQGASYNKDDTATPLTVATSASSPSYQWYSNTSNSTTGSTLISSATNASYTPSTATEGTTYYYCVVTAAGCSTISNIVAIEVTIPETIYNGLYALKTKHNADGAGTYKVSLTNAIVTYVNGSNAYIEDATGGALIYYSGHGLTAGDCLNGVYNATTYTHYGKFEITALELVSGTGKTTGATIPVTTLTIAQLNTNFDRYESVRVKLECVEVTNGISSGDRNGSMSQDGNSLDIYAGKSNNDVIIEVNDQTLIGYPSYYNTTYQFTMWENNDVIQCGCKNAYSFHFGTDQESDWTINCFTYSGYDDRQWIKNVTIQNKPHYYVGYRGFFYDDNLGHSNAKSYTNQMQYMQLAFDRNHYGNNQLGSDYAGVQGTLLCYDNSSSDNLYVDFLPDGYYFILDAEGTPTPLEMTCTDADMTAENILTHNTVWETEVQTVTDVSKKYTVGIKADATIAGKVYQTTRYNTNENMTTMKKRNSSGGFTGTLSAADVTAGLRGKYRIWANNFSTTSGEKNWYAHFVPYYTIDFELNDGMWDEGAPVVEPVSCEGTRQVTLPEEIPTNPGYAFDGWTTNADGSGTVYAAGGNITLSGNTILYAKWHALPTYTVTWYNNTNVMHTQTGVPGTPLENPGEPDSDDCDGTKVFVGWTATEITGSTNTKPGDLFPFDPSSVIPSTNKTYYAVFATPSTSGADIQDVLNRTLTGATTTTYIDWSNKKATSNAIYKGNSAGGNSSIQMRSDKANSGIVTTVSGGKLSKVQVTWESHTQSGRKLDIYGKNEPYSSAEDLYDSESSGVLLGSIVYNSSTELNISGNYKYIGLRSNSGAMYLTTITISWDNTTYINYSTSCCPDVSIPVVTVTPDITTANMSWNNQTQVTSYELTLTPSATVSISGNSATITGLTRTTTYEYTLKAIKSADCFKIKKGSFTTKGPEAEIEEWTPTSIYVDIEAESGDKVGIDNKVEGGTINVADDIFFSKYYEAAANVKLIAIYNGTESNYNLSEYSLSIAQTKSANEITSGSTVLGYTFESIKFKNFVKSNGYKLSTAELTLEPNEEIIFITYQDVATDKAIIKCAQQNENSNFSSYIKLKTPELQFNGDDAVALVDPSGNMIDLIGAGTLADGSRIASVVSVSSGTSNYNGFMDAPGGWYSADGISFYTEIPEDNPDASTIPSYKLSTNRCLLVRRNNVKNGHKAVALNGTSFVTLGNHTYQNKNYKSEWKGVQIPGATESGSGPGITNSCEGFDKVGSYVYSDYYSYFEPLTGATVLTGSRPYQIAVDDLDAKACSELKITTYNSSDKIISESTYKVPIMVDGSKMTNDNIFNKYKEDICMECDVVVLGSGTLTKAADNATGDRPQVRNVEIYPGGKLVVPTSTEYTVKQLIMRSKEDDVPCADIKGTFNRINTDLLFDKRINSGRWYFFTLPYNCNIADITYHDGTPAVHGTDFMVQYYDGAARATSNTGTAMGSNFWQPMANNATLSAGVGYILAISPKSGYNYGFLRFPMAATALDNTREDVTVSVAAHGMNGGQIIEGKKPNNVGWNLVGNPYLNYYTKGNMPGATGGDNAVLQTGELVHDGDPWSGAWVNNGNGVKYVVAAVNGGYDEYLQKTVADTDMEPFMGYFVQVASGTSLLFDNAKLGKSSIVARHQVEEEEAEDNEPVWVAINMTDEQNKQDETTLLISNLFNDNYEVGDDLGKMRGSGYKNISKPVLASRNLDGEMAFNALPDSSAKAGVPLNYYAAAQGNYTISLSQKYPLTDVSEVWLHDAVEDMWTNLLLGNYQFTSAKGDNTTRFTLSVTVKRQPQVETEVEDLADFKDLRIVSGHQSLAVLGVPAGSDLWVYDAAGKLVVTGHGLQVTDRFAVDVPASGVYNVRVVHGNNAKTLQAIVR